MAAQRILLISTCLAGGLLHSIPAVYAENTAKEDATYIQRLQLARDFVSKMKQGKTKADKILGINNVSDKENILPEGEILLLQPTFKKRLRADGVISTLVHNKKMLLSLSDLAIVLRLPINVRDDQGTAQGWYIRESKKFLLDVNKKTATTDIGVFNISDDVLVQDGDIWVPVGELGSWMGTDFNVRIASQEIEVSGKETYPLEAQLNRKRGGLHNRVIPPSTLPLGSTPYQAADVPVIDVTTNTSYQKRGDNDEATKNYNANISAVNDFAYGTLRTRANLEKEDKLSSVRLNYKQESVDGGLLGPLNARRFEVGDVITSRVPFGETVSQELGVRVTNTNLVRRTVIPSTGVSGTGTPGWDVELYRESQFLGVQTIGDDGLYQFSNINLFLADNNFRLVFYGPQGEVHEENLYVPVNQALLSRGKGVYDFSVTLNDKVTYAKNPIDEEGTGEPNFSGVYEKPFSNGVTVTLGASSIRGNDDRETQGSVNISAPIGQTLVGAGVSIDDNSDVISEASLRRNFGKHEAIYSAGASSLNGDDGEDNTFSLSNNIALQGPLPFGGEGSLRYNFSGNYLSNSEEGDSYGANAGLSGSVSLLTYGAQFQYRNDDGEGEDDLASFYNLSGGYGRNHLRLSANYDILPESQLQTVDANFRRNVNNDLSFQLSAQKNVVESLTSYGAQVDWQAGFIRLSPRISYNTNKDFTATLSTRFGLLKDPYKNKWKMYDRSFATVGTLSAFVYLDKDGDGIFNGDDEPLPDVIVLAPQNGRQKRTDENGIAFFDRMARLLKTDVFVENDSLQDPTWISGFEGISVVPREGYVAEVEFPVHRAGEIDGLVVAKNSGQENHDGNSVSIRSVAIHLINEDGEREQTVHTDHGGFYYIPQIPPGRYFLIIDSESAQRRGIIRPMPQPIEIGYDGTIMFGNNIEVEIGDTDVPSEFLSDIEDYKALHSEIDFTNKDYDLVLNLGDFNSRLLMSLVWYKMKSRYGAILGGADLFVPPKQSNPDAKTGKHTIRVGLSDKTLETAYSRCRAFMARGQYCKVEIYPSFIRQANLNDITPAAGDEGISAPINLYD
ncbi:MAG: hypothetical protein ACRBCK_04320 [Alphaproteobacteria bacterium]